MAAYASDLSPSHVPPDFAPYCHDDNLPNVDQAFNYIRHHFDSVNLNYTTLSFDQIDNGVFALLIEKSWQGKYLVIEVYPEKGGNISEVSRWLTSSRIASANLHKDLSQRRLLGAKAELIEKDANTGVTAGAGNVLFKIKSDKKLIIPGEKLLIATTSSKFKEYSPKAIMVHIPHD